MKRMYLILIVMFLNVNLPGCAANPESLPPVVSMEYKEYGAMEYPSFYFLLARDADSGRYLLTNASDCAREDARTVEVPDTVAEQLQRIVIEEDMLSYRRDYEPMFTIYDGTSWTLHIRFQDSDRSVYSSGYVARPSGHGLERLRELCRSAWADFAEK